MRVTSSGSERSRGAGLLLSALVASLVVMLVPPIAVAESPSPPPSTAPSVAPSVSPSDQPPGTLEALVDGAAPGDIVTVPPGLYRESIAIDRPITLLGSGAEIRGSDVWTDWALLNGRWVSAGSVPELRGDGTCAQARCAWPEQAFIDGLPLLQVAASPGPGQFAIDADRHVILGDDPSTRMVEVTTRPSWMTITAPDVTIDGFTMRHAASPAQSGGIDASAGADRLIVRNVRLSDAHGALISFHDVNDATLRGSDLRRGGQEGVAAGGNGTMNLTIEDNTIAENNTEGFSTDWEAGGIKVAVSSGLRVIGNVLTGNDGPGVWCDIDCHDATISGNRVSENTRAGVMFEISDGAVIEDNVIWENGWGFATWGWGAGILISSAKDAVVRGNTVAWNADGISVVSQPRQGTTPYVATGVQVLDNTIVDGISGGYALGWLQDWDSGMYAADAGNVGQGNRFWLDGTRRSGCPFEWEGCRESVDAFAGTTGGQASETLTDEQLATVLTATGLPTEPPPPVVINDPPRRETLIRIGLAVGLLVVVLLVLIAALIIRRRRSRASAT